jgi:hypothetical protein
MAIKVSQWLKGIWRGSKVNKNGLSKRVHYQFEHLESRELLSGSNAIDRLDFGNLASEASHLFEPSLTADQMPLLGAGTAGVSTGMTYREPVGSGVNDPYSSQGLTFTLAVDSAKQNYLTIKLWGGEVPNGQMYLLNTQSWAPAIEITGGVPAYPNRFYYYTVPIPLSMTQGKNVAQLTINFVSSFDAYGGTGFHYLAKDQVTRPVYSVFSHTDPYFVPDSNDATGTKPTQIGQATLDTLTNTEAISDLQSLRTSIYGSGGYYNTVIARQALSTSPGSPTAEVLGLDLWTNATTWGSGGKTGAQWRAQVTNNKPQPGYTTFPSELLSVLYSTYLLQPFRGAGGNVVSGLDHYHDSTVLQRIVSLLDGVSYMQGADGEFPCENNPWMGLISNLPSAPTARTNPTSTSNLQGVDTQTLGWAIIQLLNDSAGGSAAFQTYLSGSYNADLTNGGSMLRAYAYERMLYNHIVYLGGHIGGVESQNLFAISGLYASAVALAKLQALYPNSTYAYPLTTSATDYAKMVMGLLPDTLPGLNPSPLTVNNYGLSLKGLGENCGILSGGYDGGYGLWVTMLAPNIAELAAVDPGLDSTTRTNIINQANAAVDAFDQFIYPQDRISGSTDTFTLDPEDFITYRNTENPNSNSVVFNADSRYAASDPNGPMQNAYARRSAYLETQYGIVPQTTAADGNNAVSRLNFLRDYASYEATIRGLIGVDPTTLTELPGEPGQPDYAWADTQTGAVAFINHGEHFYMNADWRDKEINNNTFSGMGPSHVARIHDTTDTIDRAAMVYLPYNTATVQSDGNLSTTSFAGSSITGASVVRYGDYLIVLNKGSSSYSATLPKGVGLAEDLITGTTYSLGSTVVVAGGQSAIFWLNASSAIGPLGVSATGADIGSVGTTGSNSYSGGVYTISGAGADIGGTVDAFRFVSTSATGDVTISAQTAASTYANAAAKAGVMIRDSSAANAIFASVVRTPSNGILFQWRSSTGGNTAWAAVPTPVPITPLTPIWVKLTRSSNNISAYYSLDGVSWTQIESTQSVTLSSSALVGLAVSSHNTAALWTATFSNVSLNAGLAPTVATPATATLVTTGTYAYKRANLSVLGADNGGEPSLTYTWYLVGSPPEPVTFSANGTNAAKNITATFATEGVYTFRVIIKDTGGAITTNDVSITVPQIFTGLTIGPNSGPVYLTGGETQTFTASQTDQFGALISGVFPSITWSIDSGGVGSINSSGLYTAPASGAGSAVVRATSSSISATSAVTCIGIFSGSQDIGSPGLAGSSSYNSSTGTYTVIGGGSDIWTGDDQFRYTYVPITGNATIYARVVDGDSDPSAHSSKAGVMFRTSLDAQSQYVYMCITHASANIDFQWRPNNNNNSGINKQTTTDTSGGDTGHFTDGTGWVKLVRSGDTFSAYYSSSDSTTVPTTWSNDATLYQKTISMGSTIFVGLAVTARNNSALNTSTFTNVTLTTTPSTNAAPTVQTAAAASPATVTGTTSNLSVLGADDGGESNLKYTWSVARYPTSPTQATVTFSANNSNAAKASTATFTSAGTYVLNVTIKDTGGLTATSTVTVTVNQTFTSIAVSPTTPSISPLGTQQFTALAKDQFGNAMSQSITWSVYSGTGTINSTTGLYTATATGTTATIRATSGSIYGSTTISIVNQVPLLAASAYPSVATNPVTGTTVALSALGVDDAGETNLTYTWSATSKPSGAADPTYSANGTNVAKNSTATFYKAGSYTFQVVVTDQSSQTSVGTVSVTVNQTLTTINVTPSTANISAGATQLFTAAGLDQFGAAMSASYTWSVISGLGSINPSIGLYTAPMTATTATVQAASGSKTGTATVNVTVPATIADRKIFYNNSRFDATSDSGAIATDKSALLPGGTAAFLNYTSCSLGINGIMVDIQNLANPGTLSAADFLFNVGNDNNPGAWISAPAPISVTVNTGGGTGGSDRVTITWDDNVIQNQWLQVTVKADANTGLAAPDVFYFGNAIGESGDNPANAVVDYQDELGSRTHKSGIPLAPITSPYDYNRDGRVNATDDIIARHNRTDGTGGNPLQLISAPVGSPLAAGDTLQPLTAADTATSQPLSSPADVVTMQPLSSPADVVTMQPVLISAAAIVPAQAASAPVESPWANQVAYVSGGSEHSHDLPTVKSASAVDNVVRDPAFAMLPDVLQRLGVLPRQETALLSVTIRPTMTEDYGTLSPWRNDAAHNNPTSRQDSLHDAFFTHSIVQHLLTEDSLPDDSSAPADIETLINDCLPGKNDKSLAHAIDTILAAARRRKE